MRWKRVIHLKRIIVVRIDSEISQKEIDQQLDVVLQERSPPRERFVRLKQGKTVINEMSYD